MNEKLYKYEHEYFLSCGARGRGLYLFKETIRNNGQDILQDLNYTFDAVGNITEIRDDAQQTHYFNNQVIAPTSTYTYDALYRLTNATGRELSALTAPTHEDFPNNIPVPNPATNAMQNYNHSYSYDALGNMLSDNWKTYQYASVNNYLLGNDNIANQFSYDAHGNMLSMPHLSSMLWDYKDQLTGASNGIFTSYYNYDAQGNRTRKTVDKGNIIETRYYIGGYEVFRKEVNNALDFERITLNIADDEKVFVRIETKTNENPVIRYQYDNHLGSACLELDDLGAIISYEEYHPFGTTSYRNGRSEVEVSLKRYKYCGKERDEETGLYYYGMRYYAAWLCRFVSVDPLQFKYPEYTPFQYAGNKPITFVDLDGGEEKKPPEIRNLFKENAYKLRDEAGKPLTPIKDSQGGLGVETRRTQENLSIARYKVSVQKTQEANAAARIPEIRAADPDYYSPRNAQIRENQAMINAGLNAQGPIIGGSDGFGVGTARDPVIQIAAGYVLSAPLSIGLTTSSLVAGAADFGVQMAYKQDITKLNITQTASAMLLKTPSLPLSFAAAGVGSAFEITPENILDKRVGLLDNTIFGEKTLAQFGVETGFGGLSNYFGGQMDLGIKSTAGKTANSVLQVFPNTFFSGFTHAFNFKKDTIK